MFMQMPGEECIIAGMQIFFNPRRLLHLVPQSRLLHQIGYCAVSELPLPVLQVSFPHQQLPDSRNWRPCMRLETHTSLPTTNENCRLALGFAFAQILQYCVISSDCNKVLRRLIILRYCASLLSDLEFFRNNCSRFSECQLL